MLEFSQDDQLQDFFRRLSAPLSCLPQQERAELHAELRQHLDALIAAHEELGASPEEAMRAALRQFGDPARIGGRLAREWQRTGRQSLLLRPATCACLAWGLGAALAVSCFPQDWWGVSLLGLTPIVGGAVTGLCTRDRPVRRAWSGASGLVLLLSLIFAVIVAANGAAAFSLHERLAEWAGIMFPAVACWLPLGSGAAWLGNRLRRKLRPPRDGRLRLG